jgi:hypothetical protein
MAPILRAGLWTPAAFPNSAPRIDWTHPLTFGLQACYVPGVTYGKNLTGLGANLAFDTAPQGVSITPDGPGVLSSQANSGLLSVNPTPAAILSTPISLYWRGVMVAGSASTNFSDLIGVSYDNGNDSPFYVGGLSVGASTTAVEIISNGTGGAASSAPAQNTMFDVVGTVPASGNSVLYFNGVGGTPTSLNPPITGTATSVIAIGTYGGAPARFTNCISNIACIWNRVLTAAEAEYLHLNPYCFLLPPEGEMPALSFSAPVVAGWLRDFDLPVPLKINVGY